MALSHTIEITLPDGTTKLHTAEALQHKMMSDGAVAVLACCCGDDATHSWHTFYDVANMTEADIRAEVQAHVERVAQHHANVHKARVFVLDQLVKGSKTMRLAQ